MWKTKDIIGLRGRWGTALLVASSACMGVAACNGVIGGGTQGLPGGGQTGAGTVSGNTTTPNNSGSGGGPGTTGAGNGATATSSNTPTGQTVPAGGTPALGEVPLGPIDSASVIMRRLNDHEYDNTMRDLLGTTQTFAPDSPTVGTIQLPGDTGDDGFDTVGDSLSYSDLLFQKQFAAAEAVVSELMARSPTDPLYTAVFTTVPTASNFTTAMTQVLTTFMPKAWRRPVTAAEISTAVAVGETALSLAEDAGSGTTAADGGAGPDPAQAATSAVLQYVLDSPNFLFHVELGSPAITPSSTALTSLSDYEVASRLSYFLWESMPDTELTAAAAMGTLAATASGATPGTGIAAQVTRMMSDPKFTSGFINDFVGQWTQANQVAATVSPDPTMFPKVNQAMISSIVPETNAFFENLISTNAPLTEMLTADYTFVNGPLATFYGLTGIPATQTTFTKASLAGTQRTGGFLTQETFLTVTSLSTRTSPVLRGVFVMQQLVDEPPGTPPANVPPLVIADAGNQTVRDALNEHANNPACSGCHNKIDPIGFTFENFDATGAYRTTDNGTTIDASGALWGQTLNAENVPTYLSTEVDGAQAMAQAIAADPRFVENVIRELMTFGIGRTFDTTAALGYVETVAAPLATSGTWQSAIQTVATSQAFLTTRGGSQ